MDNTLPPLKRIAAIHDLSGLGKCSLTVALPVISATGVECACIPTAVLSTHTGEFTGWTFRDLSDDMLPIARHWQREGVRIDGIYSGYLASPEQAELLSKKLAGMGAHVNMIPLNNVTESGLHTSSRQAIHQFQSILEANGITATLRRTLGSDIDASCGQLRRKYEKT